MTRTCTRLAWLFQLQAEQIVAYDIPMEAKKGKSKIRDSKIRNSKLRDSRFEICV